MRGEFIRGDGLVIPNNITKLGAATLLAAALLKNAISFEVALVDAQPDPLLTPDKIIEPTDEGGYERKAVTQDLIGWPTAGELNGEVFHETGPLVWEATAPFSVGIRRLALFCDEGIMALSGALPNPLVITENTVIAERTFKYRIYAR